MSPAPISLSIVSPSFRHGPHIAATLESLLAQDYPALQHVVVDGGSDDETLSTLRAYASRYALEWISEPDAGLYDALNKALARVTGDWVGWLNCDDLYSAGTLQAVAAAIRAHPEADIISGDAEIFFSAEDGSERSVCVDRHYAGTRFDDSAGNLQVCHLNACFFRRELLTRIGPFDASYRIVGDRDYLFRLTRLAPRSHHLGRVVCRYRAHADSLTMHSVSSDLGRPALAHDDPAWPELKRLCRKHLADPATPPGVRRWCRQRIAWRLARESALALLSGRLVDSARQLGAGLRQHPATAFWFGAALLRGAQRRGQRYLARARRPGRGIHPDEAHLVHTVLAADAPRGLMIDVGAHFGTALSPFVDSGWQVWAFEPDSTNRARLTARFGHHPMVLIDRRAVSDRPGAAAFFRSPVSTGISGLSAFHDSHQPAGTVPVTTLSDIIATRGLPAGGIDFLKIDTEGYDRHVLMGLPWDTVQPRVVLCEFEDTKTRPLGYDYHDLAQLLVGHGYQVLVSEWQPVVEYGQEHAWRCFAPYPHDLHDPRAWGNLIATREPALFMALLAACERLSQGART